MKEKDFNLNNYSFKVKCGDCGIEGLNKQIEKHGYVLMLFKVKPGAQK